MGALDLINLLGSNTVLQIEYFRPGFLPGLSLDT